METFSTLLAGNSPVNHTAKFRILGLNKKITVSPNQIIYHFTERIEMYRPHKVLLITRFMWPTWGPPRADTTQVGPMLAPWIFLSGEPNLCPKQEILWWRDQMGIFPRYWPFVRGIHRSTVNSPHKDQWRRDLIFSLLCAWINGWVNNRETGDLRCYRAHYGVTVILGLNKKNTVSTNKRIYHFTEPIERLLACAQIENIPHRWPAVYSCRIMVTSWCGNFSVLLGVVSLTFRELSKIISRKYTMPSFSLNFTQTVRFLQYTNLERICGTPSETLVKQPPGLLWIDPVVPGEFHSNGANTAEHWAFLCVCMNKLMKR